MPITHSDLLAHKIMLRQLRNRQRQENSLKEKSVESAELNDALFFNNDSVNLDHSRLLTSSIPMAASGEHPLSELPFLSSEMGVYIDVIAAQLLEQNPQLEQQVVTLTKTLDALIDQGQLSDDLPEAMTTLESAIELALPELAAFELYILMYEYFLKKKRSLTKKHNLDALMELIDDLEEANTQEIIANLQAANQKTAAKMNLMREVKTTANSYHGEYSGILQQVTSGYGGNFRAMIKDLLKLNAHNIIAVGQQQAQSFEQNALLFENVRFETKLLNLMSLFCKCEEFTPKLNKDLANYTSLQVSSDLIDLLDGFDCTRMINTRCKVIADPKEKSRVAYAMLTTFFETLRYLPGNFFKQEKDRESLNQRIKQCSFASDDAKNPAPKIVKYI
jgi:hypothetical protein